MDCAGPIYFWRNIFPCEHAISPDFFTLYRNSARSGICGRICVLQEGAAKFCNLSAIQICISQKDKEINQYVDLQTGLKGADNAVPVSGKEKAAYISRRETDMGPAIIIALIMLVVIGAVAIILMVCIKKADPKGQDRTEAPGIQSAQEFLPFEDIREDMILLGQHRYRAVLTCTATNYHLKTAREKENIEMAFQRFLNSVSFPITFFLQTKVIDNTDRLKSLKVEIEHTISDFPNIANYAEQYLSDMASLNEKLGNNQQKRRYIIVTYDNADELSELTEEEKVIHAAKEIRHRCNLILSNLETVGVTARMMETKELIELVYSCYWRDDYSYAEQIAKGDCFSLFVEGETDRYHEVPKVKMLDLILGETISKLQVSNLDGDLAGKEILDTITGLRKKYAGYFLEEGV